MINKSIYEVIYELNEKIKETNVLFFTLSQWIEQNLPVSSLEDKTQLKLPFDVSYELHEKIEENDDE